MISLSVLTSHSLDTKVQDEVILFPSNKFIHPPPCTLLTSIPHFRTPPASCCSFFNNEVTHGVPEDSISHNVKQKASVCIFYEVVSQKPKDKGGQFKVVLFS